MGDDVPPQEPVTWARWYRSSKKIVGMPLIQVPMVNLIELIAGQTG
jgi:hypothetical protein